jgi:prepilin-type N-terminal cleavage/methylation domain-containing protein
MASNQQRNRPETAGQPALGSKNSIRQFKQGFSLTELLVVIFIVITLATVSFMATQNMKSKAHTAIALGNLRQLSLAAHAVADERYDILPSTTWKSESNGTNLTYWWTPLIDFLHPETNGKIHGLFRDSASPEGRKYHSSEFRTAKWAEISYIPWADGSTDWNSQMRGIKRSRLREPARQPYLSTVVMGSAVPAVMSEADFKSRVLPSSEWRDGAILLLFCDGRAEMVRMPVYKQIAPLMPK